MDDPIRLTIDGRIAVVTGAAGGIGQAAATGLARIGADVVVVDLPGTDLRPTIERIEATGRRALAVHGDVAQKTEVERLFARVVKTFGTVDVLVNNAGVTNHSPALELSEADWDRVLDVNLKGPFLCCQAAGRMMVALGRGKIVNVASQFGLIGRANGAAYCSSKGGLIQLTRVLAIEWGPRNVQVNALAPGPVVTPMTEARFADDEVRARLVEATALKRLAQPEEMVGAIQFLASPASDFITGAVLVADGGFSAM